MRAQRMHVAVLWHSCRRGADMPRLTWGHVSARGIDQLLSESWLNSSDPDLPSRFHR